MRDELQTRLVDLPRPLRVLPNINSLGPVLLVLAALSCWRTHLGLQLLVQGVVDPQVDVAPPVSLLLDGRHVGDGSLVDLSHRVGVRVALHQAQVVEPGVIVVWVCLRLTTEEECVSLDQPVGPDLQRLLAHLDLLFVLEPSFADDDVLDSSAVSELLLKHGVVLEELLRLMLGDPVQGVLVDDSDPLKLLTTQSQKNTGAVTGSKVTALSELASFWVSSNLAKATNRFSSTYSSPKNSTARSYTFLLCAT